MNDLYCKALLRGGCGYDDYRCSRKAKIDGFCKQHHPDTAKKRHDESTRKYEESIKVQIDKISGCRELREALRRCISAAGNPDPAEGCRIIIEICQEELNKE